jgi:NADH:ubiquinone oxidoreductase subunit K
MTDYEPSSPDIETGENSGDLPASGKSNKLWLVIVLGVAILGLIVTGIVFLAKAGGDTTGKVRDIFIILMALESIVIGVALIILVVQLASLINLLQNEIKPILKSTSDTVNTLKGTTAFLSENLTNPVIKVNSSVAGAKKLLDLIGLFGRKK